MERTKILWVNSISILFTNPRSIGNHSNREQEWILILKASNFLFHQVEPNSKVNLNYQQVLYHKKSKKILNLTVKCWKIRRLTLLHFKKEWTIKKSLRLTNLRNTKTNSHQITSRNILPKFLKSLTKDKNSKFGRKQ